MLGAYLVSMASVVMGQAPDITHTATYTEGLQYPGRLALTPGGGLYVTDELNGEVVEYDAFGSVVNTYPIAELPVGLAVHPDGRVFVSRCDGNVGVYDDTFTPLGLLDPAPLTMTGPNDLAVDPATGEVYVVDTLENRVLVFDGMAGTLVRSWGMGGTGLSQFESPTSIALNTNLGHVIVGDTDNFRIQVFDTMGTLQFKFGYRILYIGMNDTAWFARTAGLTVDSCGNIYVSDGLMGTVRVFDSFGVELDPAHAPVIEFGTGAGQVRTPCDVLFDNDTLYLVSTNNSAVEVYEAVCTASPAPQEAPQPGPLAAGLRGTAGAATHPSAVPYHYPDNPFDIVDAIRDGVYSADLDVDSNGSVNVIDVALMVRHFGVPNLGNFVFNDPQPEDGLDTYEPPHVLDLPNACGRCHAMTGMPDSMLGVAGQENLCKSCHTSGGIAHTTAFVDESHPFGIAADTGGSTGPPPGSFWELDEHLDGGNIRCGTCHNPHSDVDGEPLLRAPLRRAQLCGECHPQAAEWMHAGHADESADPWTHYDWSLPNRAACRKCHSGNGFIDFSNGLPDAEQDGSFRVLDCAVCHATHGKPQAEDLLRIFDEVTLPGDVTFMDVGPNATCMTCHNGRTIPDDPGLTPHYALGGVMFEGINAVTFGATIENSAHTTVAQCVLCHMAPSPAAGNPGAGKVGGHSFALRVHDSDDPDYGFENFENACNVAGCHGDTEPLTTINRTAYGDYDGDGVVEGVQDEVQGLMDLVFNEITNAGAVFLGGYPYWNVSGVVDDPPGYRQIVEDAIWNWEYVDNSGDLGIHNTGYAVGVLQVTYEQLTGDPVPDAELRYTPANFGPTIVSIQQVNGGAPVEAGGAFSVDFTIEDGNGDPIPMEELNRLLLYVSGPTSNYQRVIEGDNDPTHFAQNMDGSYTYTAADPFPSVYLAPENDSPYYGAGDGEMTGQPLVEGTYTVLIESRRVFGSIRKAGDATMDFVVADDPGSPPALAPRQFVTQANCNACHLDLQLHGSNRYSVTGCVVCHTAGSEDTITDPESTIGVTVKFSEMIHQLHRSSDLPYVRATQNGADPWRYIIRGHNASVNDFSDIGFPILPNGVTDCDACHGGAAQGAQIYTSPTRANCRACHHDIDFTTGTILNQDHADVADGILTVADLNDPTYRAFPGHDEFGAGGQDHTANADNFCAGCHGPGEDEDVELLHKHPTDPTLEGVQPVIDIVSVGGMTGGGGTYFQAGDFPEITFKLSNNLSDPLELVPGDRTVADRIEFIIAGPTTLQQTILTAQRPWSNGSLAVPAGNWVDNFAGDGTYTFISVNPLPAVYPPQLNSIGEPPADQLFPYEEGWGQQYTAGGTPLHNGTYTVIGYGRRVTPTDGEREPIRSDTFDFAFGADDPIVPYSGTVVTAACNACHGNLAFHGFQREGVRTCMACHTAGTQDGGTTESVDLRIMVHKLHNARNLTNLPYELNGFSGVADFSHLLISAMPGEAAECQVCHVNDDWKWPPLRANMRTWMVACTSCHDSAETADHADAMTLPGTFVELCTLCHGDGMLFAVEKVHASP